MRFQIQSGLLLIGVLFTWSTAAATSSSKSSLHEPRWLVHPKSVVEGSLHLSGTHFLTDKRSSAESNNYGYLGLDLSYKDHKGSFDWANELIFEGSVDEGKELYYGAPELFIRLKDKQSQVNITLGRQKRSWSELDQRLGLGVWQPQLRWDYLNPIQQGLTGAFFDMDMETLHLTFFASPVFLPDQGPQFEVKEGRFESASRWFWQPQTKLLLGEDSSNLFYELETPKASDVVMNSSLGGMMKVDPEGPFDLQLAYAYKPMNQLFIGIECSGCLDPLTRDGTARIHPMIVNHHVLTAESQWQTEDQRVLLSWTVDRPEDPKIPQDWWASELRPVSIPGFIYEKHLSVSSRPLLLGLSYFQEISGGNSVNESNMEVESSSDRYSFADLLSLSGQITLFSKRKSSFELSSRYSYSFKEKGAWLNSKVSYRKEKLETFLSLDVLGSQTDPLSSRAGLFSRYRTNDRVYGGVALVF